MPTINLTKIYNVSSEDPMFPATNLLTKISKKWKCKPKTHQQTASVIFKLDNPVTLNAIDIGNEHSTYVTVLVGRSSDDYDKKEEFQEILLTSSFMTPMESRQSINSNRVRCFSKNSLVQSVANLKCTLIKVICSQPYNQNVQYGLSFIKFYGEIHQLNKIQQKPIVSVQKQIQPDFLTRKIPKFGEIKMREESSDSDKETNESKSSSLFSRWKQSKESNSLVKQIGTAAAIRNASAAVANSTTPITKKFQPFLPKTNEKLNKPMLTGGDDDDDDEDIKIIKETSFKHRNNDSRLLYDDEDEKPNLKLEKLLKIDQEKRQQEEKRNLKLEKRQKVDDIDKKLNVSSSSGIGGGKSKTEDRISKKFTSFLDDTSSSLKNTTNLNKNDIVTTVTTDKPKAPSKRSCSPINIPSNSLTSEPQPKKIKTQDKKILNKPFNQLLDGVILVISGIQNPLRSEIRDKALQMGAQYKPDWQNNICTHLICAFKNTPKYNQVHGHGKIIKKEWILESFDKKQKLPWRRFALDENDKAQSDSEEENNNVNDEVSPPASPQSHADNSNHSQNADKRNSIENINPIYNNNEMSSSGSDTEDEINRVIEKNRVKTVTPQPIVDDIYNQTTDEEVDSTNQKSHSSDNEGKTSQIEPLPKIFKNKIFYLSSSLSSVETIKLKQIINAFCGKITKNAEIANFIISNKAKQLPKNYAGEVVRPLWVFECSDTEYFIPTKRYKFE